MYWQGEMFEMVVIVPLRKLTVVIYNTRQDKIIKQIKYGWKTATAGLSTKN